MRAWIVLVGLVLSAIALAAEPVVYRWVDKNGVVHYSDQPHPGAVEVDLGAPQVVDFKTPATSASPAAANGARKAPQHYAVRILAPADGTTLRPANFAINVNVSVAPPLPRDFALQYDLDGSPLGQPTTSTRLHVKDVYRGVHHLSVTVLAPGGATLGSASSTFYVHHPSVLFHRGGSPPGRPRGG